MAPKYPKPGQLHIDATDIKTIDLFPEQVSKLSKTRPGFEVAVECFLRLTPELIDRAGINPAVIQKAAELMATNSRCDDVLPAAEKLVELLHETRLHARHELSGLLTEVGAQGRARSPGRRNPRRPGGAAPLPMWPRREGRRRAGGAVSPECGNGVLELGEECDDGASNADNAACTAACKSASCGDGLVQVGVEQCDDGPASADNAACTAA